MIARFQHHFLRSAEGLSLMEVMDVMLGIFYLIPESLADMRRVGREIVEGCCLWFKVGVSEKRKEDNKL